MDPAIHLHWQHSAPVSAFAAAWSLLRGRTLMDSGLASSLAGPVERLRSALNDERIPLDSFWSHVLPLSAGAVSLREVAEVTLIKTIGRVEMPTRLERFHQALVEVKDAGVSALPHAQETPASGQGFLKQAWDYQGDALLRIVQAQTEAEVLVSEATVVMAYPVQGGGGAAYLPYNLVHIEAVADNPQPELPEVARLAWLLSMLNLDLPCFSDQVTPRLLPQVAALAMIPVTLAAAATIALTRYDEPLLGQALQAWLPTTEKVEEWSSLLFQWWDTYRSRRPALATALAGLEKLMTDSDLGANVDFGNNQSCHVYRDC
jgi:hypothetical protein